MGMIGNSLAQGLISGANIQDGTVDTVDLKNLAVTPAKLSAGAPVWDPAGTLLVGASTTAYSATGRGVMGINGTSAAQLYLSKAGSSSTAAYLYYDGTDIVLANDTSGGAIKFWSQGGAERARINSSGNLGMGTQSPSYRVDINTATTPATDTYSGLQLQSDNYGYILSGGIKQGQGGVLIFSQNQNGTVTERARFDPSGNFGLGTNNPGSKLHVVGNMYYTGDLLCVTSGETARFGYEAYTSTGGFNLFTQGGKPLVFGTNSTERARIDASGNALFKGLIYQQSSNGSSRPIPRVYGLPSYTYNSNGSYYNTSVRIGRFFSGGGRIRGRIIFAGDFNYAYQSGEITFDIKAWSSEPSRFCFAGREVLGFIGGRFSTDSNRYIYFNHSYLWSQDCAIVIETEDSFEWSIGADENYHSVSRPWRIVDANTSLQYEVDYGA